MLKFSIRIFEFYCELFKANNIRSFSIQYKIYGWIVFNRSLIQHLSFTVLRFVQSLMQLSTVKKIQKDASSFIFQRLSSRPDPDQPSPGYHHPPGTGKGSTLDTSESVPQPHPAYHLTTATSDSKPVPDLTATTLASRTKHVQHHHHQQVQQKPVITVL